MASQLSHGHLYKPRDNAHVSILMRTGHAYSDIILVKYVVSQPSKTKNEPIKSQTNDQYFLISIGTFHSIHTSMGLALLHHSAHASGPVDFNPKKIEKLVRKLSRCRVC